MQKRRFYLNSTNNKNKLHCLAWLPSNDIKPIAIVQIVHGMAEHIERYEDFAKFLAKAGIFVIGHDHLGHGKSVSNKEELGFFHEEKGGKFIIQDMHKVRNYAKKRYSDIPHYILGHSMGSFCLRSYICIYGKDLQGAIIMGTGYIPMHLVNSGRLFLTSIEKIYGGFYKSDLVESKMFNNYNKGIENLRTNKDWLTRDESEIDKFINDPLCDFHFTIRAYDDFLSILGYIAKRENYNKIPKNLRVLITSGDKDPVGNWGKSLEKVTKLFMDFGITDVTLNVYENARHEILNEINKLDVYGDILKWILNET